MPSLVKGLWRKAQTIVAIQKCQDREKNVDYQYSLADLLNEMDVPIGKGDYVEHTSKPGVPLLVVRGPYTSKLGNLCLDVLEPKARKASRVRLENVHRV